MNEQFIVFGVMIAALVILLPLLWSVINTSFDKEVEKIRAAINSW